MAPRPVTAVPAPDKQEQGPKLPVGNGNCPAIDPILVQHLAPIAALLYQVIDACVAGRLHGESATATPPTADVYREQSRFRSAPVPQIVGELLQAKREDGASKRYLETLRSHLSRFAAGFGDDIRVVTTADIDGWLRAQKVGGRARNNFRGSVITLFRFAQKQGYLAKGKHTEADDVARAKDRGGAIGILTPKDLAFVLTRAPERVRVFIALGAFTGMRSSEILRLEWRDVNIERRFITVAAEKAKTATRRLVPIQPNLLQWLGAGHGNSGRLFRTQHDADRAIGYAKRLGVEWPNNALRHSYATYRLALIADAARVALEMGNSPQKLMTNYRELADEKEAAAWFNIVPEKPANVIRASCG